jgi:hypothetical protein
MITHQFLFGFASASLKSGSRQITVEWTDWPLSLGETNNALPLGAKAIE